MNSVPVLLVLSVLLTFCMIVTASALKVRPWTAEGRAYGFSNRESERPFSPAAGRADRAVRNMLENMVLFLGAVIAAKSAGAGNDELIWGARIFFWSRLVYFLTYVTGVRYARSLAWAGGAIAIVMIIAKAF